MFYEAKGTACRKRAFGFALCVLVAGILILCGGEAEAQFIVEGCGELVDGVEGGCVVFVTKDSGSYLVTGDLGGYWPGDTVRILGLVDPGCFTFCMQGPCLLPYYIIDCDECCKGETMGDVDCNGMIDIGDLTVMIQNMFITQNEPCCLLEADLDYSGLVDIGDLTILISALFITLNPLGACP